MIKAVSHCRQIVTPEFITDLNDAIVNQHKIPMQSKYNPVIGDQALKTAKFCPIATRRTLFEPLQFVFMSEKDKIDSEQIVKDLGGTVALLDPLCPDRKKVILSENSIVMETKDLAVSQYIQSILLERSLVPTKHTDLVLSLFYNDKTKLFRTTSDTQQKQTNQIKIEDTQAFSHMTCTLQESQLISNDTSNLSTIEASAVPPRLDKTFVTPDKRNRGRSSEMEGSVSTIKLEPKCSEPVKEEHNNEGSKAKIPKTGPEISFYEESAVPPRLDKTIKTPAMASPLSSKPTFIDPSAVPPRLDATIKSPLNASISMVKSASFIEPSYVIGTPQTSSGRTKHDSSTSADTNGRLQLGTPTRTSTGSDASLFSNSRNTSLFSTTAGNKAKSPSGNSSAYPTSTGRKRGLLDGDNDSDEDEDFNPFSCAKAKSSFFTTSANLYKEVYNTPKKPKLSTSNEAADDVTSTSTDKKTSQDKNPDMELLHHKVRDSPSISSVKELLVDAESITETSIQSTKRELHEKVESATKKFKTSDRPASGSTSACSMEASNLTIPGTSHSVWIKRPDVRKELEGAFERFVITDISADLMHENTSLYRNSKCEEISDGDKANVNFKRFRKKGVIVRSMSVTLSEGQFRSTSTSIFEASQSQQVRQSLFNHHCHFSSFNVVNR